MGNTELDARRCRWIFTVMDSLPHSDCIADLVTLRAIWHARKKALHEQNFQCPQLTNQFIKNILRSFRIVSRNL